MKTNPKTGITSALFDIGNKKPYLSRMMHTLDKGASPFHTLLRNTIKGIETNGDLPDSITPPDRQELGRIIEMVQIQMNAHFLRAFSDSDSPGPSNGFPVEWMNFPKIAEYTASPASEFQRTQEPKGGVPPMVYLDRIIGHASKKWDVDPDLTKAVVRAESDFDVNCTSSKGAMGLMQLMPETAKELGVKNSYDPVENVMGGTRYLKRLLDRYDNNISLALAAYNWGMGNLERNPGKLPRETRNYITRVYKYYQELKT